MLRLLRKTFKSFTLLSKNVDNKIVDELMDFDFVIKAAESVSLAKDKWTARRSRSTYLYAEGRKNGKNFKKRGANKGPKILIQRSYKFS